MAQQTEPNDARVRTERDMPGTRATRTTTERRMGDAESASTLLARAQAELARGRLRAAREQFFGAAQAADAERLPVIRAEAAIGAGGLWLHELRVTDERAAFLALVRDALAGLGGARPDLQRRLHIRLAAEAAYDGTGKLAELEALVDEARNADDALALAEGLSLLHHAMLTPRYAQERVSVADELMAVAAPLETRTLVLMGMCWRTVDLFLLGHGEAERALADLRLRAEQFDVLAVQYVVAAIDTMLCVRAGRFAEAEALAMASHGLGVETGDADAGASYLSQLIAIRWMQGRAAELLGDTEEIEHATTIVHAYADYVWPIIAVLAAVADQRDRARAALDRILVAGLRSLPESSAWLPALFCVAEVADSLDDREAAHQVAELLEPYASLPMVGSLGVVCFGAAARSLGLVRRTLGDLDGAVRRARRRGPSEPADRSPADAGHRACGSRGHARPSRRPRRPGTRTRAVRRGDRSGRRDGHVRTRGCMAERVGNAGCGRRTRRHDDPQAWALGSRTR